ncbi:hypothetical protein [Helicobacter mustelae]|uniref:Putative Hsr recombination casette n=1 Tax=Helicobacter mustelae (strain ATCC 43772 / CCUG 25715 / CIP 103759 / LMG 18044 / NCTC 12198 / R85-136P) TaxID=679897 RepID=D3UI01_HELM1|nr:hypothetical protein [Helicobacter mustelae]CBG40124.1 putative Hsr recombination casette [Helicobacter mustelae 12198]SQH71631.1 Hsr recombination casette protein [Helicobacter mustelae]
MTVTPAAGANQNAEVSGSGGNATFTFTNGANTTVNGTAVPAANPQTATGTNIIANIASGVNSFTVDGKADPAGADQAGQANQNLGAAGNPVNLNFDFGGIASSGTAKTFTLNLGDANAKNLIGNLNILGGGNAIPDNRME